MKMCKGIRRSAGGHLHRKGCKRSLPESAFTSYNPRFVDCCDVCLDAYRRLDAARKKKERHANPEKARRDSTRQSRRFKELNPEKVVEYGRRWRAKNLEVSRKCCRDYKTKVRQRKFEEACLLLGIDPKATDEVENETDRA